MFTFIKEMKIKTQFQSAVFPALKLTYISKGSNCASHLYSVQIRHTVKCAHPCNLTEKALAKCITGFNKCIYLLAQYF